MNHEDHVALLKPANLPPGGTWADLGAGSGAFTLALRELVGSEAAVYAVDRDASRLEELGRAWRQRHGELRNLQLLRADFTDKLDLPQLDGIVMANSLHFFRDADERGGRGKTNSDIRVHPRSHRTRRVSASHFPDKLAVLRHVSALLRPGGRLLLVEYNVDSGNLWVPYPLSFETWRRLAPQAGFGEPRLLATHPSSFLRGFYSAMAFRQ
jgi:ubiquinone/menaquinone biosynthesis C-methylase UbiE